MVEGNDQRTFANIVVTGGFGAILAMAFQAIRISREHLGEPFNPRAFFVGLVSAGGIGAMTAWALESFHFGKEASAVIIAMSGYVGGPLLDICYKEIQETLQAAFDGLQKWLMESRWSK